FRATSAGTDRQQDRLSVQSAFITVSRRTIRQTNLLLRPIATRSQIRSEQSRRCRSAGRICAATDAVGGWPVLLPNRQVRHRCRKLCQGPYFVRIAVLRSPAGSRQKQDDK